jgi:hypothetical protein
MFAAARRLLSFFARDSRKNPRRRKNQRGSADLATYCLLTAAGCTMVGLTAPHLFKSSQTASDTFERQVDILQRGSSGGGGGGAGAGGGAGSSGWNINATIGSSGGVSVSSGGNGVSVSAGGGGGNVSVSGGNGSISVSSGGGGNGVSVSGSVGGGGGGGGGTLSGTGARTTTGTGNPTTTGAGNPTVTTGGAPVIYSKDANQRILDAVTR